MIILKKKVGDFFFNGDKMSIITQLKKTNLLLEKSNKILDKTTKIMWAVNVVNIITLIVILIKLS